MKSRPQALMAFKPSLSWSPAPTTEPTPCIWVHQCLKAQPVGATCYCKAPHIRPPFSSGALHCRTIRKKVAAFQTAQAYRRVSKRLILKTDIRARLRVLVVQGSR